MLTPFRSSLFLLARPIVSPRIVAPFSVSAIRPLKDIIETIEGSSTVVEGVRRDIPHGRFVCIQDADGTRRSLLEDNDFFRFLSHTDVLILRQFVNSDYTVLPPETTGLKPPHQKRIEQLVKKAQRANLMPKRVKDFRDTVPFRDEINYGNYDHRKYNTYYDEWDKLY